MNNFNGAMEVMAGLNFSFVKRLKQAWKVHLCLST